MQKPIRRSDRAMSVSDATALLDAGTHGVLSMVGDDGTPYAVPLSYVHRNGAIYFHCATEGRKLDHLKANPAVSFCVVGPTKTLPSQFSTVYQSAIVSGKATLVSGDEKRDALIGVLEKYSADFMETGLKYLAAKEEKVVVIRLDIEHLSGKARRS